jgi:D-glycero-D-manno-heptose 1,7-bisphosphate phosphatase
MNLQLLIVDRDGVILEHVAPYILNKEDIKFVEGSITALKTISDNNIKIAVISNQSPVNRGLISHSFVEKTNLYIMQSLNLNENQIRFYYCPHTPDEKCKCRKPNIEMLKKACFDFNVLHTDACIIGDHDTDMLAGIKFKLTNRIQVLSGRQKSISIYATDTCENLFDFVIKYRIIMTNK